MLVLILILPLVCVTLTKLFNVSLVVAHNYTILFFYLLNSFELKFKINTVYFINLLSPPIIFNMLIIYKDFVNRCEIFDSCPAVIFK